MPTSPRPGSADLRGAARLATDATAGLTDLVEAMHERIARVPGFGALDGRVGGVSGLVYRSIRGATRLVGGSIDALLGLLGPALSTDDTSAERDAIVAALNGVLGDYLDVTGNPLATPMRLRRNGVALPLDPPGLRNLLADAGGRLVVLIHGLCMNDRQWLRAGHDHGAALARDLGFAPVYLHYNSGLHISINGRALAYLLETFVACWPRRVERLVIIGHSMGGLLARSALHYGRLAGHGWPAQLSEMIFLGTPHHGAPLERAGHWIDQILGAVPYAAPFARLGKIRSAGITDLRYGNLVDDDWVGRDRFARGVDRRRHLALPDNVHCYAVAAALGARRGALKDSALGDGLVPVDSALGRHPDPARALSFAPDRQWIGYRMSHLELLSHIEVYAKLRSWLA